jgi:cytoskeletal protein RodZ
MSDEFILVFLLIFFGLTLCSTVFLLSVQMFFAATQKFFRSRFITKSDEQKNPPPENDPIIRTAESPSTANPEEIEKIRRETERTATSTAQEPSNNASYDSNEEKPSANKSGKKNVQT